MLTEWLPSVANSAPTGGLSSGVVQVAVIGGIFTLAGIVLSFVLDRGRPSPPPAPAPDADGVETELRARIGRLEHSLRECSATRQQFRDWLIAHHIDPETGTRRRARGDTP